MTTRLQAAFAMRPISLVEKIFSAEQLTALAKVADVSPVILTRETPDQLRDLESVEVLISGWGAPMLTAELLDHLPRLRHVIHTAGSVKSLVTDAVWDRGIEVSSQAAANAIPVAEYTTAMIVLANKSVFQMIHQYRKDAIAPDIRTVLQEAGNYERTVGIIGASIIGRGVIARLSAFDVRVLVSDPTIDEDAAERMGAQLVPLDELLRRSDVVSIHAPSLPETVGMIGEAELALLRDGATLINTARAELIDEQSLEWEVANQRITAILDLVHSDAFAARMLKLPNAIITPHMAGSVGSELHRLGAGVVEELQRAAAGAPLAHQVQRQHLALSA